MLDNPVIDSLSDEVREFISPKLAAYGTTDPEDVWADLEPKDLVPRIIGGRLLSRVQKSPGPGEFMMVNQVYLNKRPSYIERVYVEVIVIGEIIPYQELDLHLLMGTRRSHLEGQTVTIQQISKVKSNAPEIPEHLQERNL